MHFYIHFDHIIIVVVLLLHQVWSFSTTTTTTTTITSTSTPTIPIRIASWNVLSQQSVKVDMETKHQQQQNRLQQKHLLQQQEDDEDDQEDQQDDDEEEEDYLEWEYRKTLITKTLLNTLDADIICLQEVDTSMLKELMDDVGEYTSCCVCTNDEVEVDVDDDCQNVIILVRKDCPFQIKECKVLSSTSILAVLECCNTFLYVANVHLQSTKGQLVASFGNDPRHEQLKTVLRSIALEECGATKDANIVVAGDFNMLRYNPFHQKLRDGNFISLDADNEESSFPPLVDPYYDLQQKEQECVPLYTSGGPKKKSYTYVKPDPLYLQKTTKGGSIVDYIFTTSYERAYLCHTESKFKASIDWPSPDNPSDHIPIAIDMEVQVAATTNTNTTTTEAATENAEDDKNKKVDSTVQPEATDNSVQVTGTTTTTTTKDKRRQPKPSDEEAELAARYAAIQDIGERAYRILLDLDMV
jgi:hypothetical protein